MNATKKALPRWDMSVICPSLESPEYQALFDALEQALKALETLFDENGIMHRDTPLEITAEVIHCFEEVVTQLNTVRTQANTIYTYILSFTCTDSRDTLAQSRLSESQQQRVVIQKLATRLIAWLGALDIEVLQEHSQLAQDHAYTLHKAHIEAAHLMSPAEESLASELNLTGSNAWAKFYNNFSSQISAEIELDGEPRSLAMTEIRNLAFEAKRVTRQKAYKVELQAWEDNAMPIAAALNSIKGQMNTLTQRRGWDSALDVACFENSIDRETLEAMLDAAQTYYPVFRRYLKAKAQFMQIEKLAWYDLFAPVGKSEQVWTYDTAQDFIKQNFTAFSPRMGALATRAFNENWIDAGPRDGKRGGAFCAWLRKDESRIMANFKPAYSGMGTIAHELGHAYHNLTRAPRSYLQRQTPMTLAETASNFCELIIRDAALKTAGPEEQITIIEASLQDSTQVVVDIASRYLFEKAVFEQRQQRELSVEELNETMLESQRATYADGLADDELHPYMWAVKPHYYTVTFYNFPYMFGLLFSLGLYARYQEAPKDFLGQYDDLLSATGMYDAATLAARFGINTRSPEFWKESLNLIEADVTHFESLITH